MLFTDTEVKEASKSTFYEESQSANTTHAGKHISLLYNSGTEAHHHRSFTNGAKCRN